jgi:hypothetical protein
MRYEFPIKASREYVCPPDAGPAWRKAYESGIDMAELEDNLKLTSWERLEKHEIKLAEHRKRPEFLEFLQYGMKLIKSHRDQRTHQ